MRLAEQRIGKIPNDPNGRAVDFTTKCDGLNAFMKTTMQNLMQIQNFKKLNVSLKTT